MEIRRSEKSRERHIAVMLNASQEVFLEDKSSKIGWKIFSATLDNKPITISPFLASTYM